MNKDILLNSGRHWPFWKLNEVHQLTESTSSFQVSFKRGLYFDNFIQPHATVTHPNTSPDSQAFPELKADKNNIVNWCMINCFSKVPICSKELWSMMFSVRLNVIIGIFLKNKVYILSGITSHSQLNKCRHTWQYKLKINTM